MASWASSHFSKKTTDIKNLSEEKSGKSVDTNTATGLSAATPPQSAKEAKQPLAILKKLAPIRDLNDEDNVDDADADGV